MKVHILRNAIARNTSCDARHHVILGTSRDESMTSREGVQLRVTWSGVGP